MHFSRVSLIVCLLALWLTRLEAISPMSPAEAWARFKIKKELTLTNGPDIYESFANHYNTAGTIEHGLGDHNYYDLTLAWESHLEADTQAFSLTVPEGTTVLKALEKIAEQRKERLTTCGNYLLVTAATRAPMKNDKRKKYDHAAEFDRLMFTFIASSIIIREPEGGLDDFLNAKLQQTWELSHPSSPCPYRVKSSDAAQKSMSNANLLGIWSYGELFEVLAYLSDLRWQINGTTIQIDK